MSKLIDRRVTACLLNNPNTKDDDNLLIVNYWKMEMRDNGLNPDNLHTFFDYIMNNQVCNPQSITRIRRKLQMLYPHLRGEKFVERQKKKKKVKADLGYAVDSRED
jgi:hypothetical protein